ncbi:ABC transporter permease subunit [Microbacterium sp.]|uniref:branched-chain amino acid ABC transporter ATP-binding protein/permease n=1 Tax=Microbacterium sp. TaxID=51671 RepID=UPI003A878882
MSGLKRGSTPQLITMGIVLLILFAVVSAATGYWQYIATIGAAQAIVGLSVGVVYGTAGMLSLAQLSLAVIGSWTVAYVAADLGIVPTPWAIVLGAVVAVPIGLLVALPAMRLRGVNLAVVTLGFVIVIYTVARGQQVPGSQNTLYVAREGWIASDYALFIVAWGSFVALAAGVIVLRRSRWGLSWLALARSERAAASLGVSIVRAKLAAFGVSAFLAGWAGGILVTVYGSPDEGTFSPIQALLFFVLAVLFGAGYWEGALALGIFNTLIAALFREWGLPPDIGSIIFGLGAVQILSTGTKRGFSGDIRNLIGKIRRRRSHRGPDAAVELIDAPRPIATPAPVLPGDGLVARDVTVKYGAVVALRDVSLRVPHRTIVGLVGPNGAGKSTMIDAITGYTAPSTGTVTIDGMDVAGMPVHRRARIVRRTFQTERTMDDLTARDYLRLAADGRVDPARLADIIDYIGLRTPDTSLRHLDVRARRLLMIGGALISAPSVALLDEPAAGLDADESADLAARLREIPERFGCGVLLIEHDMDLVREVCTEVTVLDFGKVLAAGPTAEVLDDPAVAKAYLGEDVEEVDVTTDTVRTALQDSAATATFPTAAPKKGGRR